LKVMKAIIIISMWVSQVSSMKSTTKLCRLSIDDRRSTVILRRWNGIDRWYRPCSPVGESASTVDIDRDRSTGSINQWIGVNIWIGVGTISHHTWDHDFLVDGSGSVFGTISHHVVNGPFFLLLGKTRSTDFVLVWIHMDGRFQLIFVWNRRSMRYRPYFQVGESESTVNIDRILK